MQVMKMIEVRMHFGLSWPVTGYVQTNKPGRDGFPEQIAAPEENPTVSNYRSAFHALAALSQNAEEMAFFIAPIAQLAITFHQRHDYGEGPHVPHVPSTCPTFVLQGGFET